MQSRIAAARSMKTILAAGEAERRARVSAAMTTAIAFARGTSALQKEINNKPRQLAVHITRHILSRYGARRFGDANIAWIEMEAGESLKGGGRTLRL